MTTNAFLKVLKDAKDSIVMENSFSKSYGKYKEMLDKKRLDKKTVDDANKKRIKKLSEHEKIIEELNKIIHEQKLWIDNQFNEDWKEICKGDSD